MKNRHTSRVAGVLDYLELELAFDFSRAVEKRLIQLSDQEINTLYLMSHTDYLHGDKITAEIAALLPLIEKEADLRHDFERMPWLRSIILPARPASKEVEIA